MNYYQFHIGDYRGATAHLSNDEDLCYRRILDLYYDKDGILPDLQTIARRVRMSLDIVGSVLQEFFAETDSGWVHERAQREIDSYKKQSSHGKKGASARWGKDGVAIGPPCKPHMGLDRPPMPTPLATNNHKPMNQYPLPPDGVDEEKEVVGYVGITEDEKADRAPIAALKSASGERVQQRFQEFWNEYPEIRRKNLYRAQSAFSSALLSLPDQATLIRSLKAFKASKEWKQEGGKFIPSPETWLSERRWQDAPAYSEKVKQKPKPEVDEAEAFKWRAEKYPDSVLIHPTASDFPFRTWPESVRKEFQVDQKANLQPA